VSPESFQRDPLATAPAADRLFPAFRALAAALAREGILALPGDLEGLGGASFRAYWHQARGAEEPPRWSLLSTAVCSGDPVGRAAAAFGFGPVRSGEAEEGAPSIALSAEGKREEPATLRERMDRFERSLARGAALTDEGEHRPPEGGVFASGGAAYDRLLADLAIEPEEILPESAGEAREMLLRDPRFDGAPERFLRRLALLAPLRDFAVVFGAARVRLALYLERTANFIDSSSPAEPFRAEGRALLRAARVLPDPASPETWREADRTGAATALYPGAPERRRAFERELRRARSLHRRAAAVLRERAGGKS